ncbi:PRD domain-containing protein [Bacillus sp. JCM 19041]|uniref:BglG family transcription antiterminator n=1 Tax=Bacillus sp. JCM 19041 TaxID=1460637 RepID=UPI000A8940E2
MVDVSGRTVRYDLDSIDEKIRSTGARLKRMPGKGVMLRVVEEKRPLLYELAEDRHANADKDTQVLMMGLYAVIKGSFTIQQLADEFYLSRSSIQKYLPDVDEWLDHFDLQVMKQAWKGLQVIGTERSLRFALYQMLCEKQADLERVRTWLKVDDEEVVESWLVSCQKDRGIHYSEASLKMLFLFLCWWREQFESGRYVFIPKEHRHKNRYHLGDVKGFIEENAEDSRAKIHECAFLDDLFDQAKVVSYQKEAVNGRTYKREIQFCKQLLAQVSTVLQVDLQADEKLLNDLTYHVKAAFNRMAQGVEIDNPYTEEIKVRYRAIYEMVFQMTNDMGYRLFAAEVAFITMHISAAFERSRSRKFLPTVLVVCSSGLATSSILTTKLEHIEPGFHLINVVNTTDLERVLEDSEPDFVLTTQELSLKQMHPIKLFRVSPLLSMMTNGSFSMKRIRL